MSGIPEDPRQTTPVLQSASVDAFDILLAVLIRGSFFCRLNAQFKGGTS
jgi:hypothetical protein